MAATRPAGASMSTPFQSRGFLATPPSPPRVGCGPSGRTLTRTSTRAGSTARPRPSALSTASTRAHPIASPRRAGGSAPDRGAGGDRIDADRVWFHVTATTAHPVRTRPRRRHPSPPRAGDRDRPRTRRSATRRSRRGAAQRGEPSMHRAGASRREPPARPPRHRRKRHTCGSCVSIATMPAPG